jgi:peptidase M10/serralysin-like protein
MSSTLDPTGYKLIFDDVFDSFNWKGGGTSGSGTWQIDFCRGGRSLPSNGEWIANFDARPTIQIAHNFVMPADTGAADGSAPGVLLATGPQQTLFGHGGHKIFLIGTHADAMVSGSPIRTGDSGNNHLIGGNGNDVIVGGGGNGSVAAGTGATILADGKGQDGVVFSNSADHGNVLRDFQADQDELDVTGLPKSVNDRRTDPVADLVLRFVQAGSDINLVIDESGTRGLRARTLVTLEHMMASSFKAGRHYIVHA